MQYGQGMVRPGAWSLGGVIERCEPTGDPVVLHQPLADWWSRAVIEAATQKTAIGVRMSMMPVMSTTQVMAYGVTSVALSSHWAPMTVALESMYWVPTDGGYALTSPPGDAASTEIVIDA